MASAIGNFLTGTTDNVLVTAIPGKVIRVTNHSVMVGATATNVTFNRKPAASAGVAVTPIYQCGANGGIQSDVNFEGGAGDGISVTVGSGSTAGIHIEYETV